MLEITIIIKLMIAALLGGIIGWERDYSGKPAGPRTYGFVSLGSALFTLMAVHGFNSFANIDPTRIAGQIVVGIGFIGAGLIIFHKHQVEGLTTAAALWVVAGVGMSVGLGWYIVAIFTTLFVFILLIVARKLEFSKTKKRTLWDLFE